MLTSEDSICLIIDVQDKLANIMLNQEAMTKNLVRICKASQILQIPVLISEQRPEKLGPTIADLTSFIEPSHVCSKSSFSCWGDPRFRELLGSFHRHHIIIAGIETHVCVYQTAIDLLSQNYKVYVIADAVSSRELLNYQIGLQRLQQAGAFISTTEMMIFEWIKIGEGEKFKTLLSLIK